MGKNSRQKGLEYVREVKKILEHRGWLVDGPFFKSVFIGGGFGKQGRQIVSHVDMFGVGDLVAVRSSESMTRENEDNFVLIRKITFIQVTTVENEASHFRTLEGVDKMIPVLLFARCKIKNRVVYRVKDRYRERLCGYTLAGEYVHASECWDR